MKLLRSKKGFTLVEIIVVLVIIAILAAISLPALTGYITDANDKAAISEGRTVLVAAQTISSELSGLGAPKEDVQNYLTDYKNDAGGKIPDPYTKTIMSLTGMRGTGAEAKGEVKLTTVTVDENGSVQAFTYTSSKGKLITYSRANDTLTVGK